MKNQFILRFLTMLALAVMIVACNNNDDDEISVDENLVASFDAEVPLEWNALFLEIERNAAGYRPTPAPRVLGYIGLAAYEATVSGMPAYQSLADNHYGIAVPKAEEGREYHWPTVVNAVYSLLMPRFFPDATDEQVSQMSALSIAIYNRYEDELDAAVFESSKNLGSTVANAIWEWAASDPVAHNAHRDPFGDYVAPIQAGKWAPTYPGPGKPMFPYAGQNRTFAIRETDKLARPPLPYSESPNSPYYAQGLEVYSYSPGGEQAFESKWIGEYWSDDLLHLTFSPGPRWVAIANQVIEREQSNLETAILTYARVGMALNDAAVACWYSKFYYNVERPVTYIQKIIDPTWNTPLNNPITGDLGVTPSFPAYPSGHSTMGAAAAEALTSIFGNNYAMSDRCHDGRFEFVGLPRSFDSFYQMAEENAWSRVLLGVHFRMDCTEGVRLGYLCGKKVSQLPWEKQ